MIRSIHHLLAKDHTKFLFHYFILFYHRAMPSLPIAPLAPSAPVEVNGDTPTLRLFALLEVIAAKDQYFSLQSLADETAVPKPTLHRMLQQLEGAQLLERSGDGRHYGTGVRLRRLAENLLMNDTAHGARHAVLRTLVAEVGESVIVILSTHIVEDVLKLCG